MQFTPQQMAGGAKYSSVTRIGNWQEEIALEESRIENFRNRSSTGSLALRKMELKIKRCNEVVPLSFSEDGIIRFGDTVILQHDDTGSIFACDPFEEVLPGQKKFFVSTVVNEPLPKARYTFRVVRPPDHMCNFYDDMSDPIVHIGQSFMLQCDESLLIEPGSKLLAPPMYLSSTKKNERMATKRTNRQLVFITPVVNAESIWTAIIPSKGRTNSSARFLAMGQPLNCRDAFQLTHRQTNMYLTCDAETKTSTEFGIEYECFADRSTACGKLGLIVSEMQGLSTSQTLAKPDASGFSWHFVTSSDPNTAFDDRNLPPPATTDAILSEVHEIIRSKGLDSFWNLREYFQQLEQKTLNSGKLDREDMKACLLEWGINTPFHHLDSILNVCDRTKTGLIDIKDLLQVLRGPMSPYRQDVVSQVFEDLDVDKERHLSPERIIPRFRGEDHPLVSIGGFSEDEALQHFLKSFEIKGKMPRKISYERFLDYYADLSASIDDDEYFESIVRSNWSTAVQPES